MAGTRLFVPTGPAVTVTVANGVASAQTGSLPVGCTSLLVMNEGPGRARIRIGKGAQTVQATDFPVPSGLVFLLGKAIDADSVAAMGDGGSATLLIVPGEGE